MLNEITQDYFLNFMNDIRLNQELLTKIKKVIDKHAHDEQKPEAYNEFMGYYSKGFMTKGQASKIQSFYNNYTPTSQPKDKEKKRMYDSINLLPWVNNQLTHLKNTLNTSTQIKKHIGKGSQTGRTVDRMTTISKANIEPPQPPNNDELYSMLREEIQRFQRIVNYIM